MASKYTGVAVIQNFAGTLSFVGGGTFIKDSGDYEIKIQVDEITDDDNEVVTLLHSNEKHEFTFLFTPRAAVGAPTSLASAKLALAPPALGLAITLTGFPVPAGGDFINSANWVYVGGFKLAFKKNGVATYSLKIMRHPTNNLAAQPAA